MRLPEQIRAPDPSGLDERSTADVNIDDLKQKAQRTAGEHGDKVEGAMDKGAEAAKQRFGREEQIDAATEKGREFLNRDQNQRR